MATRGLAGLAAFQGYGQTPADTVVFLVDYSMTTHQLGQPVRISQGKGRAMQPSFSPDAEQVL